MTSLIQLSSVNKSYKKPSGDISVLRDLELEITCGEFLAIMGASGSGKSTLLHIVGCLDRPTAGHYLLAGRSVDEMGDEQLSGIRAHEIGFVFQNFHLLPYLSVAENVAIPFLYREHIPADLHVRIEEALQLVGLSHRATHDSSELSGGEMQRVAIARALIGRPQLILADEPTGSLDSVASEVVMDILARLHQSGSTVVLVTHDAKVADFADRRLTMKDGCFVE
jgi:ABC-type lipoprotein export system ATPase subunit